MRGKEGVESEGSVGGRREGQADTHKLRLGGRREAWKDGREGKNRTETKA